MERDVKKEIAEFYKGFKQEHSQSRKRSCARAFNGGVLFGIEEVLEILGIKLEGVSK